MAERIADALTIQLATALGVSLSQHMALRGPTPRVWATLAGLGKLIEATLARYR